MKSPWNMARNEKTFFAIHKNSPYLCPCIADLYFSGGQLHIERRYLRFVFLNELWKTKNPLYRYHRR